MKSCSSSLSDTTCFVLFSRCFVSIKLSVSVSNPRGLSVPKILSSKFFFFPRSTGVRYCPYLGSSSPACVNVAFLQSGESSVRSSVRGEDGLLYGGLCLVMVGVRDLLPARNDVIVCFGGPLENLNLCAGFCDILAGCFSCRSESSKY